MRPRRFIALALALAAVLVFRHYFWFGEGSWVDQGAPRPLLPLRTGSRGCCVFGVGVRAEFVGIPLPFVNVSRVADPDELGPHRYDSYFGAIDDPRGFAFPLGEANAFSYTCRGGFIDTAHLREPADWVAFFINRLEPLLDTGGEVELAPEGASRRLVVEAIPPAVLAAQGRDETTRRIAQWAAYQISTWHEIAQWYRVSLLREFPEVASAFSPEDNYSNLVGIRMLDGLEWRPHFVNEIAYNALLDELVPETLRSLAPVPKALGDRAMRELDGLWWDSSVRLPLNATVKRRYFDIDSALEPWMFPLEHASPELRADLEAACRGISPETARIHETLAGVPIRDLASYELTMDGVLAEEPSLAFLPRRFDQSRFPDIVEVIRQQAARELGPDVAHPH